MFLYETHLHTAPVSKCARANVEDTLAFYQKAGYAGVFITNHFLCGNINGDRQAPYHEQVEFFFSDYEAAVPIGKALGIDVLCGVELSYKGTDFLVYGLDKAWYLSHPEIMEMSKREELAVMMEAGALVIQAHPYREAAYIDHIRLFPRSVHGVEIDNACRTPLENKMARLYADNYGLLPFAGSDNHVGADRTRLSGLRFSERLLDEADFINRVLEEDYELFSMQNPFLSLDC